LFEQLTPGKIKEVRVTLIGIDHQPGRARFVVGRAGAALAGAAGSSAAQLRIGVLFLIETGEPVHRVDDRSPRAFTVRGRQVPERHQ
jgi:hypothetical protein